MAEVNRREFLGAVAALSAMCALCSTEAAYADGGVQGKDLPPEKFDAGVVTDFAKDQGDDKFSVNHQVLISYEDGKLIAMTSVCTHKQMLLNVDAKGTDYICPKGAWFNLKGEPAVKPDGTIGPAGTPLVHYAISIDANNHVIVDTGSKFNKDKWDDPKAFVNVPKS